MTLLEELRWRGLIHDSTDAADLEARLVTGPLVVYCGFDPTGSSLHLGNLVPLLGLRRFQRAGHRPIALAGGATGSIGDPSGRASERQLLDAETLAANVASIKRQLARLLEFDSKASNAARLLDNASWMEGVGFLEFLREVGKHFSVNQMVAKESVRARMQDRETGISYTEFSYMLLQAYDFYHLAEKENCELQIGGADQWGNITAGADLCRKKAGRRVHGLTFPLITNADGTKFGKSTGGGSVWLDPGLTSVYRFYQYFMAVDDRDVVRFLKFFTFLEPGEISALEAAHAADPGRREAHRTLAREVTALVHGAGAAADAERASALLFGGSLEGITEASFREVAAEVPLLRVPRERFGAEGAPLVDLLVESGLCPSKGQARKDIAGGGAYVNNERVADAAAPIPGERLLFGRYLLLRRGKRNYALVDTGV
ncbi:MAG: tyrosine--tRNA ligase [Puniceicoccaceae bacterium]|nr:MAG: tyrosine--tRNA ligase [Puniceicoccaceae bacterium]